MRPGTALRVALIFGILAASRPAAAQCPEARETATAAFSAWGPVAQVGPSIVRFVGETGGVVVRDERVGGALVGFSPDGQLMISASPVRVDDAAPPCTATHVWVRVHDLAAPASHRIARLRGGRPLSIRFSLTGRHAAVAVADADGDGRLHLFDLERGRRRWVARAVDATWLDEAQLILRERHGRLSLNAVEDGSRLRVVAPPARRLVPFAVGADASGFWATMGRRRDLRFVRVHLEGERTRIETRDFELPGRPVAIAPDGSRGALRVDETIEVRDLASGEIVGTVSGRPSYDDAALSDAGRSLLLVSAGAVELLALDESTWLSWGGADPPSELVVPISAAADDEGTPATTDQSG